MGKKPVDFPGQVVKGNFIPRLNTVGLALKLSGDIASYKLVFAAVEVIERSLRGFECTAAGDAMMTDFDRIAAEAMEAV